MAGYVKRGVLILLIALIATNIVGAVKLDCPSTAEVNSQFQITVSYDGAIQVALLDMSTGEWDWKTVDSTSGYSYTYTVTAPSYPTPEFDYYGAAKDSGGNEVCTNYDCYRPVKITTQNNPTSITFTAEPSPVPTGQTITLSVTASDNDGINQIIIKKVGGSPLTTQDCKGTTPCTASATTSESSVGTYTYQALVTDSLLNTAPPEEKSVTVTSSNTAPSFITSSPLPTAQKGMDIYTTTIRASPDGDSLDYSLGNAPSGMSIDSSGLLTWKSPDSTRSFNVRLDDHTNPLVSQAFTIPVIGCTSGTQPCYSSTPAATAGVGICRSGTQTCSNGIWGNCIGEVTPATEICDGLDNNCDGQVDEGCDKDNDLYCDSAMKCAGTYFKCSNGKCLDCDDENKNISPSKKEICNLRDDNCDGIEDGKDVCTCSLKEVFETASSAEIVQPADGGNYYVGEPVAFYAREKEGAEIRDYKWDLGDGQSSFDQEFTHAYTNKGDYHVKLTYLAISTKYKNECEKTASVSIHVLGCLKDADCGNGKACKNGICVQQNATMAEGPFTITINSPSNQVYSQKTVPLSITTSKPAACYYSLNDGDQVVILPGTNSVEGREGLNTLKVKCANTTASAQFTVKTTAQQTSMMDDIRGDLKSSSEDSIWGFLKNNRKENSLSEQEAQGMLSETAELGEFLEVGKSMQLTNAGSIIMLNVKNKAMFRMDAKIDVTIPKSIADSASELSGDFRVIKDDPVVEFDIANLTGEETLLIEVSKAIDMGQLDGIGISAKEDLGLMLRKQKETDNAMDIKIETQEVKVDGQTVTRIRTYLEPKKTMEGVALIQNIPKCLAKQIDYLKMDEKYRSQIKVLNPDPLIMWQFEEITSEKYFEYEVKGVLSEDCKKQIKSLGIADELGLDIESRDYFSIILPLMIIPLLGLVVVRLHRFSDIMKKREKETAPEKMIKPGEKPKENEPRMYIKGEDEEKFLQKEIEEAEEEFKRKLN